MVMLSLDPSCHILFLSCMSWDEDIPVSPVPAARKFCPSTWAKINCELTSVSMWLRIHLSPIGGFCHSDGESMRLQTPIYRNSTRLWRTAIKDINKEDDVFSFFYILWPISWTCWLESCQLFWIMSTNNSLEVFNNKVMTLMSCYNHKAFIQILSFIHSEYLRKYKFISPWKYFSNFHRTYISHIKSCYWCIQL